MTDKTNIEQITLIDLYQASALVALITKEGFQQDTLARSQVVAEQAFSAYQSQASFNSDLEMPVWATCRATDEDGTTIAYEKTPTLGSFAWHSNGGREQELEGVKYQGKWENSLIFRGEP